MEKKINEYCNKNRNRCCKTTSKRVVQKTAEATGDFSGNKIADKITSLGKPKSNERNEISELDEIYILPGKRQQIIDDLRLF